MLARAQVPAPHRVGLGGRFFLLEGGGVRGISLRPFPPQRLRCLWPLLRRPQGLAVPPLPASPHLQRCCWPPRCSGPPARCRSPEGPARGSSPRASLAVLTVGGGVLLLADVPGASWPEPKTPHPRGMGSGASTSSWRVAGCGAYLPAGGCRACAGGDCRQPRSARGGGACAGGDC